ncbi:aminotransferase [Alphaproteobacteria bacterium]|nr:aminotransferase [Alphaproteobacteria bacterium]
MSVQQPRSNYAKEIWQKDKDHFVHPWSNWHTYREEGAAMTVASSEGAYVMDMEGNKYLDGIGGLWCVNIGYGREEMVQAIADQVRKLPYFSPFTDTTNTPGAELAAKIAELAPGDLNHVFYTTGGSTAIDSAFRLVQAYFGTQGLKEKRHVIGRHEAYHGSTYIAQSIGCKEMDRNEDLFDFKTDTIHHISTPDMYRCPEGLSESQYCDQLVQEFSDKVAEIGADKVAAFFAEPIMGAGGVRIAPAGYHRGIWDVCQEHDILFVADEVVTGFGRLGHWFVSKDMFDVQPDIITSAKGLTSGYIPLGAMIFSSRIYDVIAENDQYFTNGFTYSGHPVACAAGLKSIEIMEREDICGHVREVGAYFRDQLDSLSDLEIVGDVRGSHFMCCVEFVANKETKALFEDVDIGARVAREAENHKLIVRPVAHLNVLSPPLTLTKEQCDFVVSTLRASIEKVQDDLREEGIL